MAPLVQPPAAFAEALRAFGPEPLVVFHNDADGLSAGAILIEGLRRAGHTPRLRIIGRGENAYSPDFARELAGMEIGGLIVADLGVRAELPKPQVPTILIDHHVPTGLPENACVISGIEDDPIPTSSLLAYRAMRSVAEVDDLLWLSAIGIIGDMAEKDGFLEMAEARERYGVTALRNAAALVNAPRRSASGDASAALELLLKADGPKAVLSGEHRETATLLAAREEVKAELDRAKRAAPKIVGQVAIIRFHSPCQIHPLVAQSWRGRLKDKIVIAANTGYREGWVHFATRTSLDLDILEFLAAVAPPGADENYGNGHRAASGGALRDKDWTFFVQKLGFGPDMASLDGRAAA